MKNRRSIANQAAEQVLDAILSGELSPGERIIETKLSRHLGVGQSTLREALQELEHKGLLTKYAHRGTFVTKLTESSVEEIYSVRMQLEPLAGSLACKRMGPESHTKLLHLLGEMEKAGQVRDFRGLMKNDHAFHQLIWKLSGNSTLERALELICAPLFAFYLVRFCHFRNASEGTMYDFRKDLEDHSTLLEALQNGDSQTAQDVFRETLEIFRIRHLKHVREAAQEQMGISAAESGSNRAEDGLKLKAPGVL